MYADAGGARSTVPTEKEQHRRKGTSGPAPPCSDWLRAIAILLSRAGTTSAKGLVTPCSDPPLRVRDQPRKAPATTTLGHYPLRSLRAQAVRGPPCVPCEPRSSAARPDPRCFPVRTH